MIKIFLGGAGEVTPSNPPPPTNNICLYPPHPLFVDVLQRSLNDTHPPPPHFKHPSLLPPPHPPPLPPLTILIIHITFDVLDRFQENKVLQTAQITHNIRKRW